MSVRVVLGSQWGDEGKGKLVDGLLSKGDIDIVARCAGGHNAGHTLVIEGVKYSFHILPSGLINPRVINIIGNGTVVHLPQLEKELKELQDKGVRSDGRLFISDRAHVLLELHKLIDGLEEAELGSAKVGTTGSGIGPAYSTKASRSGIRMSEMLDKARFDARIRIIASGFQKRYGDLLKYDVEKEIADFDGYRERMRPLVVDTLPIIFNAQQKGQNILVEGANALLLDIDYGTYPYVTSSSTSFGGIFTGLGGIQLRSIKEVIGVVKSYQTRVGSGPFPTELNDDTGKKLQNKGAEFGTTTGRQRRCGWLDLCALRYSSIINNYDSINLTKLDVLDTFEEIQICIKYVSKDPSGNQIEYDGETFPGDLAAATAAGLEVEYVTLPGWMTDITDVREWDKLPPNAQTYVKYIESAVRVPIKYIGVGPGRDAVITR